ncbi:MULTISPECIES: aminomethyl-transferring glycine dehydrogenase [Thalassolituus]|uniref:aminomethyl-transferring glycine dehydrogenase n=1 Tax=Thalassolituus TaxID=187492 RepID=UPI0007CFFF1B|nr:MULTISPECIES: aminomethyl-transferring glycine dehydrogenase [Thalassolituus]KZZ11735.1 glycine dehydrogenase (aminomethyl-transferring) [Oleibacter sp. HI0075]MAX85452.1 glycine dehydrogenase (aminomethyl-transferring) [Oceanospirillaceae bacterium]|tara:strand:- start:17831 stop:20746 length:2916 start_codon:yes stop_codon:yes gene_type:complete
MSTPSLRQLEQRDNFVSRHIASDGAGYDLREEADMLAAVGADSLESLTSEIVPADILRDAFLSFGEATPEAEALARLKSVAAQNKVFKSYIGLGYHDVIMPPVILRNVLENPGWYTAYTPYQPEIAQGRLEALLNFQQMIIDFTGMELANASLLDEGTAAAEAMAMAKRSVRKNKSNTFYVDELCLPQTIDVVRTRAEAFGWDIIVGPAEKAADHDVFGALFQYPGRQGEITDFTDVISALHEKNALAAVASDLMALIKIKAPGEMGADIVLGNAQHFGVPMGFGGPHAAFFATRDAYKRSIPGRIIGVSIDAQGNQALRMALQTREQHIRREKANSNICTAQVLLANLSSFYAVYHGPTGLKTIANRIHRLTDILAAGLKSKNVELLNTTWFDTLTLKVSNREDVLKRATDREVNLRDDKALGLGNDTLGVTLGEKTTASDVAELFDIFLGADHGLDVYDLDEVVVKAGSDSVPAGLQRLTSFLEHPTFNKYHTEHEMLRYMKRLESKDLAMNHSMITLGSCTMKLNATTEMIPVTWPEFSNIHPFAPKEQTPGYEQLVSELDGYLRDITGFDAICMQPNSGAQGEYAGLLAIKKYHESRGEGHRNVCLIPRSAHGTNPASAQMASMRVVVTECDEQGNVDFDDLKKKAEELSDQLSCLMLTYPSTHGVYEKGVKEICDLIHQHGGQVYMDGANLNAQVGVTQPAFIGADVSHMNLHKTFAIPHGGGGPGMGPIGVAAHLAPFVANHAVRPIDDASKGNGAVSAAPYGSASILTISWMYITLMGGSGLRTATQNALLKANYLAKRLSAHYPILYSGLNGRVAHECIVDLRPIKAETGITEVDIAKRLMDYGFHAPTMSFPVAGTFMIEPTESESKAEIDRFADAMIAIKAEIDAVQNGVLDAENNPLKNAPHTAAVVTGEWERPYSRELAAFPVKELGAHKFWPTVGRIDDVYGDRNLICSCPAIENYED